MRFGLFIPQGWRLDLVGIEPDKHWAVMRELAGYADDSAWDSLWVYDHFHTVPMPTGEATHEAWSLMSAYAATTSRIKLGQMCTAMSYRNPVYLAKVAATADIISGGRIQMGIGGGWYEHEWRAYGYGFPSAKVRLGRLDEGVQIMRDAWRDGKVSFTGGHYRVDGAIVTPKPLQHSGIPFWIAGGGEKVTLRIAAKYAHYTNFTPDPRRSPTSPTYWPSTVARWAPTSAPSCARSTSTPSSAPRRPRSKTGCSGSATGWSATCARPRRMR
jgi:F420-dependent oxidoreductase-like protein